MPTPTPFLVSSPQGPGSQRGLCQGLGPEDLLETLIPWFATVLFCSVVFCGGGGGGSFLLNKISHETKADKGPAAQIEVGMAD